MICFARSVKTVALSTAVTLGLGIGSAEAVIFDFSFDEFPEVSGATPVGDRIGITQLIQGTGPNTVSFSLGALKIEGSTITNRTVGLYVPSVDTQDADLLPLAEDTMPNLIFGTRDINPIWAGNGNFSDNSLILQEVDGSGNDRTQLDDEGNGSQLVLSFTNTSGRSIFLERLTFIDDVDAIVRLNDPIVGRMIGDIEIDGLPGSGGPNSEECTGPAGTGETRAGDNCVAGLTFGGNRLIGNNQSFYVTFNGSGGVLGFETAELPVPGALPLMIAALGGLGWVARRRKA